MRARPGESKRPKSSQMTLLHHVNDNKFNADELAGRKGGSDAAWMAATCQHKRVVLASRSEPPEGPRRAPGGPPEAPLTLSTPGIKPLRL